MRRSRSVVFRRSAKAEMSEYDIRASHFISQNTPHFLGSGHFIFSPPRRNLAFVTHIPIARIEQYSDNQPAFCLRREAENDLFFPRPHPTSVVLHLFFSNALKETATQNRRRHDNCGTYNVPPCWSTDKANVCKCARERNQSFSHNLSADGTLVTAL